MLTLDYVKAIMHAAFEAGRIPRDPTVGVRRPRRRDGDRLAGAVGPDRVPTRAEVLAILDAAPDRYRAAVALGVAGLRIGEVLGVQADRLDLERRELLVDRQLSYVSRPHQPGAAQGPQGAPHRAAVGDDPRAAPPPA